MQYCCLFFFCFVYPLFLYCTLLFTVYTVYLFIPFFLLKFLVAIFLFIRGSYKQAHYLCFWSFCLSFSEHHFQLRNIHRYIMAYYNPSVRITANFVTRYNNKKVLKNVAAVLWYFWNEKILKKSTKVLVYAVVDVCISNCKFY